MLKNEINKKYNLWLEKVTKSDELYKQLNEIKQDDQAIHDAFYRDLEFGTGGLRGIIGAGTNRVNVYTIAKASQGLASYVIKNFPKDRRGIAISYDSRIKSDLFAKVSAEVFAANGIKTYIYPELMPTPCLSFAVRELSLSAGIMVTASHNPARYNGYKVYGADGCQITEKAASDIYQLIQNTDIFEGVKKVDFETARQNNIISYISSEVYDKYIESVKNQSLICEDQKIDKNVSIVYSPLNGAGLKPVLRALSETGFDNITVVEEQRNPDGNFPTCSYPNPEVEQALSLSIEYAKKVDAELVLATDPDCDRVGIAVKKGSGEYRLMSGNETGLVLIEYIASQRMTQNTLPKDPVIVKTIVTTELAKSVAAEYGIKTIDVLTGFKFIGEQVGILEANGKTESFVFGLEDSFGYLCGSYVRDKDGVVGAVLIAEMFAFYRSKGIDIIDVLEGIYKRHGYCLNSIYSFDLEGEKGFVRMREIMSSLRQDIEEFLGFEIIEKTDYIDGIDGLPQSDVVKFTLSNGCTVIARPSGTEPKLKAYVSVMSRNLENAKQIELEVTKKINEFFS